MDLALSIVLGKRQRVFSEALIESLRTAGIATLAYGTTVDELIDRCQSAVPAFRRVVIVIDALLVPGDPQLHFLAKIRRALPGSPTLLLVDTTTPELAIASVDHEIEAVIPVSCSLLEVHDAIRRVAAGNDVHPAGWLATIHRANGTSIFSRLSARQIQVLELVADGLSNAEIADRLALSPNTVKFHLRDIYRRLHVSSRLQAAAALRETVAASIEWPGRLPVRVGADDPTGDAGAAPADGRRPPRRSFPHPGLRT